MTSPPVIARLASPAEAISVGAIGLATPRQVGGNYKNLLWLQLRILERRMFPRNQWTDFLGDGILLRSGVVCEIK